MILSNRLLKFVYRGILTGMPITTYNPYNKNIFHAPMKVLPQSTYLNFKLDSEQSTYLSNYIHQYNSSLDIVPISLFENDEPSNYLSVNIYNCSSPVLSEDSDITRCEVNTYVKDQNNNLGTLIIDYVSNSLSMDPVNVFKSYQKTEFYNDNIYSIINCFSKIDNLELKLNYTKFRSSNIDLSDTLIDYTDNIFYKNGILDKVYYDASLTRAVVKRPIYSYNLTFIFKNLTFKHLDSIFYFEDELRFVGAMWHNLYKVNIN